MHKYRTLDVYKVVGNKKCLIKSSKPSVFGMRQRLKFKQFNNVNAIGVILKLSVFVTVLTFMI